MEYPELLDLWGEKVLAENDRALARAEELSFDKDGRYDYERAGSYKVGHLKGYADGLRMALAILSRLEQTKMKKK